MTLLEFILVLPIPLASLYTSTILIIRSAFLVFLFSCYMPEILGGLFQTSIYLFFDELANSLWTQLLETSHQYPDTLLSFMTILLNPLRKYF